ncbi:MAG: hypothetical protein R2939_05465 [Kofleriaceae bacterium]
MPRAPNRFLARLPALAPRVLNDVAAADRRGRWRPAARAGAPVARRPLVVELGCADAAVLRAAAVARPDHTFVGIDWGPEALCAAADGASGDVTFIHGRGQALRRYFADGEVDELWIFHPEPCDRPRQRRNRLLSPTLLLDAHAVLTPGAGRLTLKTDHPGYYGWALGLLGMPPPPWFAAARAGQPVPAHVSRLRADELLAPDDVAPVVPEVAARFAVGCQSTDFWADPVAQAHVAGRGFAGRRTAYEEHHARRHRPIYLLELRAR